jgi:hypothetical protein
VGSEFVQSCHGPIVSHVIHSICYLCKCRGLKNTLDPRLFSMSLSPDTSMMYPQYPQCNVVFSNLALGFYLCPWKTKGSGTSTPSLRMANKRAHSALGAIHCRKTQPETQSSPPRVGSLTTDRLWHLNCAYIWPIVHVFFL